VARAAMRLPAAWASHAGPMLPDRSRSQPRNQPARSRPQARNSGSQSAACPISAARSYPPGVVIRPPSTAQPTATYPPPRYSGVGPSDYLATGRRRAHPPPRSRPPLGWMSTKLRGLASYHGLITRCPHAGLGPGGPPSRACSRAAARPALIRSGLDLARTRASWRVPEQQPA